MGAAGSKADANGAQHVFSSQDAPVRFSGSLVDSLQSSTESDTTRSIQIEQLVQQRVKSELDRLLASEQDRLKDIASRLDSKDPGTTQSPPSDPLTTIPRMRSPLLTEGNADAPAKEEQPNRSHDTVSKEIAELKKKLEGRRKVGELDPAVAKAKEEVVRCLRTNDRRPLDCWKEVDGFRKEVGRLEREFVERTVR